MKLTPEAQTNMTNVARARSRTWAIMGQVFSPPTLALASDVQDGTLVQQMRGATAWAVPNQGNTTLGDVYRSLRSYAVRNEDTPAEVLVVELRAGFESVLALESAELDYALAKLPSQLLAHQEKQDRPNADPSVPAANAAADHPECVSDDVADTMHGKTGSTARSLVLLAEAMEEQRELCLVEAARWEAGELERAGQCRALQHQLLEAKIVPLWPIICDLLREHTESPIYQVFGWLGLCLLTLESGRGYIQS